MITKSCIINCKKKKFRKCFINESNGKKVNRNLLCNPQQGISFLCSILQFSDYLYLIRVARITQLLIAKKKNFEKNFFLKQIMNYLTKY